jgi:DNA polymerase-3 subunit beta
LAHAILKVEAFGAAVRQAAIMADDEVKKVLFKFNSKKLVLQAQGSVSGKSKVELEIDYQGPDVEIAFNPIFVSDLLKVLPNDSEVRLDLIDAARAARSRFRFLTEY